MQASCSRQELIESLDDPRPEVARAAIARLVGSKSQHAAAPLRSRLLDIDLSGCRIATALRRIGDSEIVELAIAALSDQRYPRRLAALRALGALGDERAAKSLEMMLADDVAGVRAAALDAMAQLRGPAAVDAAADCARLLSDAVPHVRIAAVRALGRLVTHPGDVLAPAAEDEDRLVRLEVAQHAARLPEHAVQALLADPDLRVRGAAARAARIRDLCALSVLLTDDPAGDVHRASAHALGSVRDQRVADLLVVGLEDPDAFVRAAVLHALGQLLSRDGAVRRLCEELDCKRPARRRAVVYALARLRAREVTPELARLADDPDPDVRLALIHSADAFYDEPEHVMRYLAADPDIGVRQATEMWLLRAKRP